MIAAPTPTRAALADKLHTFTSEGYDPDRTAVFIATLRRGGGVTVAQITRRAVLASASAAPSLQAFRVGRRRRELETAVEAALALLDEIDDEPDLEEEPDRELDTEAEPSLPAIEPAETSSLYAAPGPGEAVRGSWSAKRDPHPRLRPGGGRHGVIHRLGPAEADPLSAAQEPCPPETQRGPLAAFSGPGCLARAERPRAVTPRS